MDRRTRQIQVVQTALPNYIAQNYENLSRRGRLRLITPRVQRGSESMNEPRAFLDVPDRGRLFDIEFYNGSQIIL